MPRLRLGRRVVIGRRSSTRLTGGPAPPAATAARTRSVKPRVAPGRSRHQLVGRDPITLAASMTSILGLTVCASAKPAPRTSRISASSAATAGDLYIARLALAFGNAGLWPVSVTGKSRSTRYRDPLQADRYGAADGWGCRRRGGCTRRGVCLRGERYRSPRRRARWSAAAWSRSGRKAA